MKRIPKSLQMGPHTVTVKIISEEEMAQVVKRVGDDYGDQPPFGLTVFETYTIYVQRCGKGFSKKLQMHTFWHEYFHMLFWCVGRERLSRDETLVDNLGALQLQAFQSAE